VKDLSKMWKPIFGYENRYEISENGDVWSILSNKLLSPGTTMWGYLQVFLYSKKSARGIPKSVHKLVAENFLGVIPTTYVVDHKDENKKNNHYTNLEIKTNSDNTKAHFDRKYGAGRKVYKPSNEVYVQRERIEIDDIVEEKWEPVVRLPYFNGFYEVSQYGNVRMVHNKAVITQGTNRGYKNVKIFDLGTSKTIEVHRLVGEAFLGPLPKDHVTNHIDSNRANNHISNLEYTTPAQNNIHALQNGYVPHRGQDRHAAILTDENVREIKVKLSSGVSQATIASDYGVKPCTISNIKTGTTWSHID